MLCQVMNTIQEAMMNNIQFPNMFVQYVLSVQDINLDMELRQVSNFGPSPHTVDLLIEKSVQKGDSKK